MPMLVTVCDETQNLNETESETFFRYQFFAIPNPILFSIPNFSDTESDTFFDTKFFPIPIPILFSIPKFFETDTDTIKKNGKVSKPRSFETEMSHSESEE